MKQYLDHMRNILDNGIVKEDRTGTGTRSIFGHQMRFDLRDGFPLVTTKKMFTRGMIEELLWFVRGSVDVKELQAKGVHFWDSWVDEEGTIGPGYGKQMRAIEYITPVTPKIYFPEPLKQVLAKDPSCSIKMDSDTGTTQYRVGQAVHLSSGSAIIAEELAPNESCPRIHWRIQYIATGYVTTIKYAELSRGQGKDPYQRSVYSAGYYGEFETSKLSDKLVDLWRQMIRRCYDITCKAYSGYGGVGVHVHEDWHCFANFLSDFKKLPNWELKLEHWDEYQLDKDALWASNRYGANTCMWACAAEQDANKSNSKYFTAVDPSGEKHFFYSIGKASRAHDLNPSAVHRCLQGALITHKGWSEFNYVSCESGKILRYRVFDQLKMVVASLRHNPDSRRHIVSLWNVHDVDRMELPPCHGNMIQFGVEPMSLAERLNHNEARKLITTKDVKSEEELHGILTSRGIPKYHLSCHMYQRSADWMLGVPVNIASYALLTMMIAKVVNMVPKDFIHSFGDTHLYSNHTKQAHIQLSRQPHALPTMNIKDRGQGIDDFVLEDFELVNYECDEAIKAPVAV